MGKGVRYTPEFREKAVRLLAESRDSHSSGTRALAQVAGNLGVAPGTLRRRRRLCPMSCANVVGPSSGAVSVG